MNLFEFIFVTELGARKWLVTGLADDFERLVNHARVKGAQNGGIKIQSLDEEVDKIAAAHEKSLRQTKQKPNPAPSTLQECTRTLESFLKTAFG